uniref:Uncharacterized protein n=1 Tax=Arion vulgaris TaxID=1028688 RepID=A0A0B7A341_9EUPU
MKMKSSVNRWNNDKKSMHTAYRCKQQKPTEVCMVEMTAAGVDPRAVMIHFHDTSATFSAMM